MFLDTILISSRILSKKPFDAKEIISSKSVLFIFFNRQKKEKKEFNQ